MTAFIVILGQDFSGTMLYILSGVIALIVIFALLIAKEMFSSGKKNKSQENNQNNPLIQETETKETRKKAKKEDKKAEQKTKEKPKKDFVKDFNNLKKRIKRKKLKGKEYLKEVSKFMRTFFSEVLEIDHEFTYEELEQALAKKRKRFIEFPKKIQELQYGSEIIIKDDVDKIADELYEIVKSFHTDPIQEKQNVWNFFSGKISAKQRDKKKDAGLGELEKKFDISVSDGDVNASIEIYNESLKVYSKLSEDEKRKEYPRIHKMYDLLNKK